jgi:hypothetical protein
VFRSSTLQAVMTAAGCEQQDDFADDVPDGADSRLFRFTRRFARLKVTWFGKDFSTSDPVDADNFVERTREKLRSLCLYEYVLDSEELLRVEQEDIEHTSLTVKQLRLTGQQNSISGGARSILRKFRTVSIKTAFDEAELGNMFTVPVNNLIELKLFTIHDVFETISRVCRAARNLREVTVTSEMPVRISLFQELLNLTKLELQTVMDDAPAQFWPENPVNILIIHDCRLPQTFGFLNGCKKLVSLELEQAPNLHVHGLLPALTRNLKSLTITGSTRLKADALLGYLIRNQVKLTTLKLPLEHCAPNNDSSLTVDAFIGYFGVCGSLLEYLDIEGHQQLTEKISTVPLCHFQTMKLLNLRRTGVRNFSFLMLISYSIFHKQKTYRHRLTNLASNQDYRHVSPFLVVEVSGAKDELLVEMLKEHNVVHVVFHPGDPECQCSEETNSNPV